MTERIECPLCHGAGNILCGHFTPDMAMGTAIHSHVTEICWVCDGTGYITIHKEEDPDSKE